MKTSKTIKIKINSLPEHAKIGNILPGIKYNLIAAPPLYDSVCKTLFRKQDVLVTKDKKVLLRGLRDPTNRLWRVPLIHEEEYTPSTNYYDILAEENDNNQQSGDKEKNVFSPTHCY